MTLENGMELCDEHIVHQATVRKAGEHMPDGRTLDRLAELFKLFGDPTRVRILCALFESEMCVCDIAELLGMGQSAISHQLRLLKAGGLVRSRREGKSVIYALDDDHVRLIYDQGFSHVTEPDHNHEKEDA